MDFKKTLLVFCLIMCILFTVSSVTAGDVNDTAMASEEQGKDLIEVENQGDIDDSAIQSGKDSVSGDPEGSFSDIQTLINSADAGSVIELSNNYVGSGSQISVDKKLTINGNGATFDAKEKSRAFYVNADNVVLKNINFVNCYDKGKYQDVYGGAVYLKGAHCSLVNCTFTNCKAQTSSNEYCAYGGAVYIDGAYASVEGCSFVNCSAVNDYSNMYYHARDVSSYGGAIYLDSGADHASVKNCEFVNSNTYAKAYSQDSRGWSGDTSSYSYGGAIYWKGAQGSLLKCNFESSVSEASSISSYSTASLHSKAYSYGGDVYWNAVDGSIADCLFANSNAKASAAFGYGTTDVGSSSYGYGGALYLKGSSVSVSNCRFVNSAVNVKSGGSNTDGGGIDWSVSGTSSRFAVYGGGAAVCFDVNSNGKISDSSFSYCAVNGNYNKVLYNAKSVVDCTFNPKISTAITASKVTATYGVSKKLTATLKDGSGNPLKSAKVTVKVGTISKTIQTDANGQVSVDVSGLLPKTYTAKISFDGNGNCKASSATAQVAVKKATPKLTAKAKTFKKSVRIKKYSVTLKTNKNKVMKNTKVTIKVNGVTYAAKTNTKGVATFKITKLSKVGKYTALVKFAGNKYYNAKTAKPKITVA